MFVSRFSRRLGLCLILLWAVMLMACDSSASTPTPPVTDTPTLAFTDMSITNCAALQSAFTGRRESKIDDTTVTVIDDGNETYGYVKDQLLITGNPDHIDAVLTSNSASPQLTKIELGAANSSLLAINIGLEEVIRVYELTSDSNVLAVATAFNNSVGENQYAVAEPNYILGYPQYAGTGGDPGSPGVEGGGGGGSVALAPPSTFDLQSFLDQWAFDNTADWHKVDGAYLPQSIKMPSGQHVNLLIFDSSPLDTGSYYNNGLCVHALLGGPGELPDPADNHGLFVASLASATATEGNIHLIQVLKATADGQLWGDLVTLLSVMDIYHNSIGSNKQNPQGVAHTVINLSLGFKFNPALPENAAFIESVRQAISLGSKSFIVREQPPLAMDREFTGPAPYRVSLPVVSLGTYFEMLEKSGYVIVAAAGNDGLELPQSPASLTKVIGVEAVTYKTGERACFSNRGDISAPGGGPLIKPPGDDDPDTPLTPTDLNALCQVDLASCEDTSFCADGVTGHMLIEGANTLGYWAGTSFATPLVSGVAVSAAEYALSQGYALTPAQVRQAVYCTATGVNSDLWKQDPESGAESVGTVNPDLVGDCVEAVRRADQSR